MAAILFIVPPFVKKVRLPCRTPNNLEFFFCKHAPLVPRIPLACVWFWGMVGSMLYEGQWEGVLVIWCVLIRIFAVKGRLP